MGACDIPAVKAKLLEGKRGLIVGIANDQSIAWGCAKAFRALGAELAVTYLNDKAKPYVEPLARELEAPIFLPLDVRVEGQLEAVFERIAKTWGELDFVVHSIAFSPKDTLQRPRRRRAARRLPHHHGRVVLVLHPHGASRRAADEERRHALHHDLLRRQMVVENYNIMGVAKAALESAVRYLAAELGPKGIRVHAISPGPLATRAASGHPGVRRAARQGQGQGAGAAAGQHRRRRRRHAPSWPTTPPA